MILGDSSYLTIWVALRAGSVIFALPKNENMKDSIDFGSMEIPRLFRKLLIPTVLGMVFSAAFVITDGIFVGRGVGSDALAAVNITAPLFLINTGVGLMFGVGASVVASIHLAHGKVKTARINVTQAVVVSSLLLVAYSLAICLFAPGAARLLGSSERLMPLVLEYMYWFVPFLPFSALLSSGMFFVRLDGAPNYAMLCNAVPAVINIALDYVFIFLFGWGMFGAALATSLGYVVGAGMILAYLSRRRNVIRFCRVKTSRRSLRLTRRNVGYMCRLGLAFFILTALFSRQIVGMFLDEVYPAYGIAVGGLPLFASGFVFFAFNIVSIGYFQSVERARPAMTVTLLRGFVLLVACFVALPPLLGVRGIWLAVPCSEVLTAVAVVAIFRRGARRARY